MIDGNNLLSNYIYDNAKRHNNNDNNNKNQDKNSKDKDKQDDESPLLSFAQIKDRCYCCNKAGHKLL